MQWASQGIGFVQMFRSFIEKSSRRRHVRAHALAEQLEARRLLTALPAGFTEALVADGLGTPTAMAFAPDGRVFIAQQSGEIKVIKNLQLLGTNFAEVDEDSSGERGVLGITLDPTFGQPGGDDYLYVYYVSIAGDKLLSRFRADGDVASSEGEQVLADFGSIHNAIWHMGGAINFGADGKLYVAIGDHVDAPSAQSLDNLQGKILRLNKDGSVPTDNPFYNETTGINRSIWALGLRNPFTTAWQPTSAGGRFYINDVGADSWEEIDEGIAGANYGWPTTEGDFDPLEYPDYTRPIYAQYHDVGSCIVGGAFYETSGANDFPAEYHGQYFFGDFTGHFIRTLDPQTHAYDTFATGTDWITGLGLAPDGSIWYSSRGSPETSDAAGKIYVIQYVPDQAPLITQQPKSQVIAVGEPVTFSVSATGASPFTYQWQRNGIDIDGATSDSYTIPAVSFADSGAGFRCIVSNSIGTSVSVAATLTVANTTRPVPTITAPVAGTLYTAGDEIFYSGIGIDEQDGTLPASAFTWQVDLHHDEHYHSLIPPTSGATSGSFVIPTTGETSDNVFYRITLTVTDSQGFSESTYRDVLPRKATLSLRTNIDGMTLLLDGQTKAVPLDVLGVQGMSRTLEAPLTQTIDGITYEFVAWSDGGDPLHEITFPSSDATYIASYRVAPPEDLMLNGTGADDAWLLRLNAAGTKLLAWHNVPDTGPPTLQIPTIAINSLTINGLGGDDTLTLDLANGAFNGIHSITFDGGADGSPAGDTLRFVGTNSDDTFDLAGSYVLVGKVAVEHDNVERLIIDAGNGDDTVNVNGDVDLVPVLDSTGGDNLIAFFGGTHDLDHDLAADAPGIRVAVHNDAVVNVSSTQHLESLTMTGSAHLNFVSGSNAVLFTRGLSLDAHATLDLGNNDMIVETPDASAAAQMLELIRAAIFTGRDGGSWLGDGITSSAARLNKLGNTTLGAMLSGEFDSIYGSAALFHGIDPDASAVLVKYTYYGDANFDGRVNFDDYVRIDIGFASHATGWTNGDFNMDGVVNFDDYVLIDIAFNTQSSPLRRLPVRGTGRTISSFSR